MTPCIPFEGYINANGYGMRWCKHSKRMMNAHRALWIETHGPIPDHLDVMHACDNRACVNLDHLSVGTRSENLRQMAERKRRRWDGIHSPGHKLTEEQVADIRSDPRSHRVIGRDYGLHHSTIGSIKRGKSWAPAST